MDSSILPVSSKTSRIELAFGGENASDNEISQGWDEPTNPLLLELPDHLEFGLKNVPPTEEALVDLTIDAEGRVLEVAPYDEKSDLTQEALTDLRTELMKWSFFPATKRTYAVQTHLALLIKFHAKKVPPPYPTCPQSFPESFPRTFVRVDLQYEKGTSWSLSYGGYPASGRFESIESINKLN